MDGAEPCGRCTSSSASSSTSSPSRATRSHPGELGENVTTAGVDLLDLPLGTRIRLGDAAEVELTGLRNPCVQIERFQPGLMKRLIRRDGKGAPHRRAGVMAIVVEGGVVRPGDTVTVELPPAPHEALPVV